MMQNYKEASKSFEKLAAAGREESMKEGGLYWKSVMLMQSGDSLAARNTLKSLINRNPFHYYAFRAKERLGLSDTSSVPAILNSDSIFFSSDSLPEDKDLVRIMRIGEIIGYRYGEDLLNDYRKSAKGRKLDVQSLWNAYHRIGAYRGAFRLAIQLREKERRKNAGRYDPSLLRHTHPPFYNALIRRHAVGLGVPPGLVTALIRRESAFEVDVRSSAGALGLMQIMPVTGKALGKELGTIAITPAHLTQSQWNIRLGIRYLRKQIDMFDGVLPAAVAAYNAGPDAVKRWILLFGTDDEECFIESIEFTETRNYVKRVLSDFWIYRQLYGM